MSKKQRRPQEDERRRKEQGAAVSETCSICVLGIHAKYEQKVYRLSFSLLPMLGDGEEQANSIQDATTLC